MNESPLNSALRYFESTEANLLKLEQIWKEIEEAIPAGLAFGQQNPEYENNCRNFHLLLESLPKIDEWKPNITLMDLDEIAQNRLDAQELGEPECIMSVERNINEPGQLLREYRYRFDQNRRELIRDSIKELIVIIDKNLQELSEEITSDTPSHKDIEDPTFDELKENVSQIDTLLGSSVSRPKRWPDLHRHLHFGLIGDLNDIIQFDWPNVKEGLKKSLYGEKEPIPVGIEDLSSLVKNRPKGSVTTKLDWGKLSPEDFERLIFNLISSTKGYENPDWLMKTNAPDKGRDLSVFRVHKDLLTGTVRQRVIIQCKHWQNKSVAVSEVAELREQMKLWEPQKVDICIIATTGRFTTDAVTSIEKNNQSSSSLKIEMWPESHLEHLLASRPGIIAEFNLR